MFVPAATAGSRTEAGSAPLVWTRAWPLYRCSDRATSAIASSGHRDEDQLRFVEDGLRLLERARAGDELLEARPTTLVSARHCADIPAGARERNRKRGPYPPGTNERDPRPAIFRAVLVVVFARPRGAAPGAPSASCIA